MHRKVLNAAGLDQIEGQWMKMLAFVVWKLAPTGVEITSADIDSFAREGGLLLTHVHRDSFEFKIVTPDSVELITRQELMKRNTLHRYPKPIAQLIQLRGALNRQINKRDRRAEQD